MSELEVVGRTELSSSKIQGVTRITLDQLLEMPTAERVELAQAIWESVAQNPDNVPLTQAQLEELERRLEAFERNPNAGSTWEFLKERKARQRAVAAEAQARAINKFLTEGLLFQATPEQNSREKKVTLEQALARATALLVRRAARVHASGTIRTSAPTPTGSTSRRTRIRGAPVASTERRSTRSRRRNWPPVRRL